MHYPARQIKAKSAYSGKRFQEEPRSHFVTLLVQKNLIPPPFSSRLKANKEKNGVGIILGK